MALYEFVGDKFKSGAVCRYKLEYPFVAGAYDELIVNVTQIQNAVAYLVETDKLG